MNDDPRDDVIKALRAEIDRLNSELRTARKLQGDADRKRHEALEEGRRWHEGWSKHHNESLRYRKGMWSVLGLIKSGLLEEAAIEAKYVIENEFGYLDRLALAEQEGRA